MTVYYGINYKPYNKDIYMIDYEKEVDGRQYNAIVFESFIDSIEEYRVSTNIYAIKKKKLIELLYTYEKSSDVNSYLINSIEDKLKVYFGIFFSMSLIQLYCILYVINIFNNISHFARHK